MPNCYELRDLQATDSLMRVCDENVIMYLGRTTVLVQCIVYVIYERVRWLAVSIYLSSDTAQNLTVEYCRTQLLCMCREQLITESKLIIASCAIKTAIKTGCF